MKKCFVIMPYGGVDEKLVRHYSGVFHGLISPAAAKAGYTIKRSDLAGEPGNITHDIISDLADADVVVADLTAGNANVFFELGIRHAFRKSGTVHIIDIKHEVPFDVRQYRALQYSTDLADIPGCIEELASAILKREQQPDRSDNPVHDAIAGLPVDIRSTGDEALRAQLRKMQETITGLQKEKESLEERLAVVDPSGTLQDGFSEVDRLLDQADNFMKSTGEHVLLRLKQRVEEGGADAFAKELRTVLRSPYLTGNDFIEIARMCKQFGLVDHRRVTLEIARQRYPGEDQILLNLIDAYDDSTNPTIQERGRQMIEEYLAIIHGPDGPQFQKRPKGNYSPALGLLFNFYFTSRKAEWVLSVARSAEREGITDGIVLRNKARALASLGRMEEADKEYKRVLELAPGESITHVWYGDFLDDLGRFEDAYRETEAGVLADPNDGTRYVNLAIQIMNRGLTRDAAGKIMGPIPPQARIKVIVPLLTRALQDRTRSLHSTIIGLLVRADALTEAQAISAGRVPDGTYDTAVLDYISAQSAS